MAKRDRTARERRGIRLYFWNLWYNLMPLIMVNFLFVLCCIPVVTVGPALVALNRITCLLADGKMLIYPIREFWDAFRSNFKQGFLAGLLGIGYFTAVSYCVWLLNQTGSTSLFLWMVLAFAVAAFAMCMLYVFPQIAMLKLELKQIFGNAVRLMLVRLKQSILGVLLSVAIILLPLVFWPWTMLLYLVILFSASTLIACSFVWPGIRMYLVKEE